MPKYFDIHSHLNSPEYSGDFSEVVERLRATQTYTITVGTDLESSRQAVDMADKYGQVYACIGVHPVDNPTRGWDEEGFEELVKHPKVVAIGECGLDFFHSDKEKDFERQKSLFLTQIHFATKHGKPIMIHARDSYAEILDILEPIAKEAEGPSTSSGQVNLRGNAHFFAGDVETARRFLNIGFTLSFTGVITFTRDYDEVVRSVPLDMLHAETDAPWVAPIPYRGKRNEPSYVSEVVKQFAEIRGEDVETVQKALTNNAKRVFGI